MPTVPGNTSQSCQPSDRTSDSSIAHAEYSVVANHRSDVDDSGSCRIDHRHSPPGISSPGGPPCDHSWRWAGHHREDARSGWCERPGRIACVKCAAWCLKRCGAARASRCDHCADVHRGDVASVGRSGWLDHAAERGYFVTLTAPGADELPWDTDLCRHSPDVACSGTIGCVVEAHALALWHNRLGQRWSWFVTEMRRRLGDGVDLQFFKTWEPQSRGALHAHALLRVSGPVTDRRFRAAVRLSARLWGFGRQCDVQHVDLSDTRQVARRAGYAAKYATKNADGLPELTTLDPSTGELSVCSLRSWSASRGWGDTMACVRERRQRWAATHGRGVSAPPPGGGGPGGAAALDLNRDRYAITHTQVPPE